MEPHQSQGFVVGLSREVQELVPHVRMFRTRGERRGEWLVWQDHRGGGREHSPRSGPQRLAVRLARRTAWKKRSVGLAFGAPATDPASVTSRPSRIQVMPSATTTRTWKRPHGSGSSRAGMSVSTTAASRRRSVRAGSATVCVDISARPVALARTSLLGCAGIALTTPVRASGSGAPRVAEGKVAYNGHVRPSEEA